ncbi:Dyp-type peroxidase [uncultured Microbacterium sp.]|uniref:Dyp-type peroxidase n=1 Tax=uncultured Microbacterium sp. TaxID=191216 RepID=UPI0035CB8809
MTPDEADADPGGRLSRRGFFALGGSAVVGAAVTASALGVARTLESPESARVADPGPDPLAATVEFTGIHQAGIATPPQQHLVLLAFDVRPAAAPVDIAALLREWSSLGRRLAVGDAADPADIGAASVASGTPPSAFTITVGVGAGLVARLGVTRPEAFVDLPAFPGDALQPGLSGGDLLIQLCADDPLYLAAAARALRSTAVDTAVARWQLSGFRGAAASATNTNPRNLMGQIDGTDNIAVNPQAFEGPAWISDGPSWAVGGSYLAVRRFRMLLDAWERTPLPQQERAVGRHKATGAPLGEERESDPLDLDAIGRDGQPVIPVDSHVRLAKPVVGAGEEMLRRSYSYSDGQTTTGEEDAGLLFLAYHRDPRTSFIPVQQRLAERDAMGAFTLATASSMFLMLPGVSGADGWIGQTLFS